MTENEANKIKSGDYVVEGNRVRRVNWIRTSGIAAPYFRLSDARDENDALVSHSICRKAADAEIEAKIGK